MKIELSQEGYTWTKIQFYKKYISNSLINASAQEK